ncbi:MAG TPA: hypothetical protein VGI98_04315 [Candidatus Limnocylindrales bacterium]|jgi:hypothetical protein
MRRRLLSTAIGLLLAIGVAGTALADSCANVSRAPAPCGFTCDHVVIEGNWVWLPSLANIGQTGLPPFWGFLPPGGPDSQMVGAPGHDGNYQNGFSASLLGHSAYCLKGVNQDKSHGVVSGCE